MGSACSLERIRPTGRTKQCFPLWQLGIVAVIATVPREAAYSSGSLFPEACLVFKTCPTDTSWREALASVLCDGCCRWQALQGYVPEHSPQVRSTGVHSQEALAGVSSEARQSCLNTAKEILGDFWLFLQTSKSN